MCTADVAELGRAKLGEVGLDGKVNTVSRCQDGKYTYIDVEAKNGILLASALESSDFGLQLVLLSRLRWLLLLLLAMIPPIAWSSILFRRRPSLSRLLLLLLLVGVLPLLLYSPSLRPCRRGTMVPILRTPVLTLPTISAVLLTLTRHSRRRQWLLPLDIPKTRPGDLRTAGPGTRR